MRPLVRAPASVSSRKAVSPTFTGLSRNFRPVTYRFVVWLEILLLLFPVGVLHASGDCGDLRAYSAGLTFHQALAERAIRALRLEEPLQANGRGLTSESLDVIARSLGVSRERVDVVQPGQGASGTPVYIIRVDGKPVVVLKSFAANADQRTEVAAIEALRGLPHLEVLVPIDGRTTAVQDGQTSRHGVFLEYVESTLTSLASNGGIDQATIQRVARAALELHSPRTFQALRERYPAPRGDYMAKALEKLVGRAQTDMRNADARNEGKKEKQTVSEAIEADLGRGVGTRVLDLIKRINREFSTYVRDHQEQLQVSVVHADFNIGNIVSRPEGISLIDLAGLTTGPAFRDVGRFIASVYALEGSLSPSQKRQIVRTFLDTYFEGKDQEKRNFERHILPAYIIEWRIARITSSPNLAERQRRTEALVEALREFDTERTLPPAQR